MTSGGGGLLRCGRVAARRGRAGVRLSHGGRAGTASARGAAMRRFLLTASLLLTACTPETVPASASSPFVLATTYEEAGRYLFLVGGCNDCHSAGWTESNGTLPDSEWALGNPVGFRGAWGTTYAPNLRLFAAQVTEAKWVQTFRGSEGLPPMPWMNYRAMPEADLVAIQRFLKSLGARGKQVPDPLPPGKEPVTPYVDLTPKKPKSTGP